LPQLHVVVVKLDPLFKELLTAMGPYPALAVLTPETPNAVCLFVNPGICQDVPSLFNMELNFLFWDIVHPTTEAHHRLAEYIYDQLEASYRH
jgi:phospholipase/lecithinase/hemolysin